MNNYLKELKRKLMIVIIGIVLISAFLINYDSKENLHDFVDEPIDRIDPKHIDEDLKTTYSLFIL